MMEERTANKMMSSMLIHPGEMIKDEIVAVNNNETLPGVLDAMKNSVLYRAYTEEGVDIPAMLAEEQAKLG